MTNESTDDLRERFFDIFEKQEDLRNIEEYPDSQFLMCFNGKNNKIQTVKRVATHIGCSRSTARKRLNSLVDAGLLYTQKIGQTQVFILNGGNFFPRTKADWKMIIDHLEGRTEDDE